MIIKESLVPQSYNRARASTVGPQTLRPLAFSEIEKIAGTQRFNQQVLHYYQTRAMGRKSTLVFAKNLNYVDNLTKVFNDAGIQAKSVISRTPKNVRQGYIESFARGDCSVLITCLALSEGFDAPQVSLCTCTGLGHMRWRLTCSDRLSHPGQPDRQQDLPHSNGESFNPE
jgi:superfamily II DNA or RNA helicase